MSEPRRRRSWHRSVVTWLALSALLPTTALVQIQGSEYRSRRFQAAEASGLAGRVSRLGLTISLWMNLGREETASELRIRAAGVGLGDRQVGALLGFDPKAKQDEFTAAVAADFAKLHDVPAIDELRSVHSSLLSSLEAVDSTVESRAVAWRGVLAPLLELIHDDFGRLLGSNPSSDTGGLHGTVIALENVWDLTGAVTSQTASVLALIASHVSDRSALREQVSELGGTIATMSAKLDRLTGTTAAAWQTILDDPLVAQFELALRNTLDSQVEGIAALPVIAPILPAAINRIDKFEALLRSAVGDAVRAADDARAAARQRADRAMLVGLLIVGMTVAVVTALALLVVRPMRLLSQHVARLGRGDIDDEPPTPAGPRELALITRGLSEVVATVRTVEVAARAIANLDLDAPSLQQSLPGTFGSSIGAATSQLVRSVRDRLALEQQLAHDATHDSLTGLLNRNGIRSSLRDQITKDTDGPLGILFIDLDGFKAINDVHGHAVGDDVLRHVADRIKATVADRGDVGRFGGDEFLATFRHADSLAQLVDLAQQVIGAIKAPIPIAGKIHLVSASIGVTRSTPSSAAAPDPDSLIRDADYAMFQAKVSGKSRVEAFDEASHARIQGIAHLEKQLREAIAGHELRVHYQPIVTARRGQLSSVEALVRWQRSASTLVYPDHFIPIAERSDLILDLGREVLDLACAQVARWEHHPALGNAAIAVNLSAKHMLAGVGAQDTLEAVRRHDIDPTKITVEITETALLSDLASVDAQLDTIRSAGVRIAIDDFGTGYTSIGHLRDLEVDVLKIDRSFVEGLHRDVDNSIVRLLIDTAHLLDLTVVAEGVERTDQRDRLERFGCDHLQGFLFSRPLAADALERWITSTSSAGHPADAAP